MILLVGFFIAENHFTLSDYLTSPNPESKLFSKPGATTAKAKYLQAYKIIGWKDFNIGSLRDGYSDILDCIMQPHRSPPILRDEKLEIHNEISLQDLASHWNVEIVSQALLDAHRIYETSYMHGSLAFDKTIFNTNSRIQIDQPNSPYRYKPDWAGYQIKNDLSSSHITLLIGDSKVSSKWESSLEGLESRAANRRNRIKPFMQLTTYCISSKYPVRLYLDRTGASACAFVSDV